MSDLNLDYEKLRDKLNIIESDINSIEDIFKKIVIANNSLDESKWKSTEKVQMDNDYFPYVNNLAEKVPEALREHLNYMREATNIYENLDSGLKKEANEKLEDFSIETLE